MFELQQLLFDRWLPLGAATPNFGVVYRELHANLQHPHSPMRIVDMDQHIPLMECDSAGEIKPFSYGEYSHLTRWDADFDQKPFDPFHL